jgi:hypothetical protein
MQRDPGRTSTRAISKNGDATIDRPATPSLDEFPTQRNLSANVVGLNDLLEIDGTGRCDLLVLHVTTHRPLALRIHLPPCDEVLSNYVATEFAPSVSREIRENSRFYFANDWFIVRARR